MRSKNTKQNKKSGNQNWTPHIIFLSIIGLILTYFIVQEVYLSKTNLIPISIFALIAGLILESLRIIKNLKDVLQIFVVSYFFSLVVFLPSRYGHSLSFEDKIVFWEYFFIFIYALFFVIIYKEKIVLKFSESLTLVLSISLFYWAFDNNFLTKFNWLSISFLLIGISFSFFSLIHSLTKITLTHKNKILLSIWSSIIILALAIDSIVLVFKNPEIESVKTLKQEFYIGLQFFLLGVSSIYFVRNFLSLVAFITPNKGDAKKLNKENKDDHINRYSSKQASLGETVFCLLFTMSIYGFNYVFQFLPRNTLIWIVFLIFPTVLFVVKIPFNKQGSK